MRRLGSIRPGKKEGNRPTKLAQWRLTSPAQHLLEAAAELYGGTVQEWTGSPHGRQWELLTESDTLEVQIPPGEMAFDQFEELWSGGGCTRRCNGVTELTSGEPCMCPQDPAAKVDLAAKGKACKPTTRLFVIQPRLPDIGLWQMVTHSYFGAREIAGTVEIIRHATTSLVLARLRLDQRQSKKDGQTKNYAVPVIELPDVTTAALMAGTAQAEQAREAPALGSGSDPLPVDVKADGAQGEPATAPRQAHETKPSRTDKGWLMRNALQKKADKLGIDQDTLNRLCRENTSHPFNDLTSVDDINRVLAALDGYRSLQDMQDEEPF